MRLSRRSLATIAAVVSAAGLCADPAIAARPPVTPGHWELMEPASPGSPGKSADPGVSLVSEFFRQVAWVHQDGPLDQSLRTEMFGDDGGLFGFVSTAAEHWTNLSDGAFLKLRLFFGGQQSTAPGSRLGLMADLQGGAVWSFEEQITDTYGTVSASPGPGDGAYLAFESDSRPAVNIWPLDTPMLYPTSGIPGVTESSPNIVTDGPFATVAWCAFGSGVGGVFTQRIDLATNQLVGTPVALPGSTTTFGGTAYSTCVLQSETSRRTPMVARVGGGVFVAGTTGYPTLDSVVVWKVGGPTLVADRSKTGHQEPEVIADPSGRIWVGWVSGGPGAATLVVRRSNTAATVLGAPVTVKAPPGWLLGSFEGSATATHLDVFAQFSATDSNSFQHSIVLPGLTLQRTKAVRKSGGRTAVTYRVVDAGTPVAGAKVTSGRVHRTTGATGAVTLTLKGSTHAIATKAGYTKAAV